MSGDEAPDTPPAKARGDGRGFDDRHDRLRGDRLATMADLATAWAHELTQPLTAATNYLSAASRLVAGNSEAVAALDKAAAQMVRAGRIVGRLREFMAPRAAETLAQSLHEIIRAACELASPALGQANVKLALRLDAPQDCVLADRVEIEQAVIHLLRHAAAADPESPDRTLAVRTSVANGAIQTDIVGAGPGAAEPVDAGSLTPLRSTGPRDPGGGLPIACLIIEAHRGQAWAAPGRAGFALPLAQSESGAAERRPPESFP